MSILGYRTKRLSLFAVCLLTLLVVSGTIFIKGITPPSPTGTWAAAGNGLGLSSPRAGAAAVQLQDGRILITGGDNGSGAVASADIYDTLGNISAAAPMNYAHSQHTATVLQDGTVLVAGGLGSGGVASNSAEIYNPSTNSWTVTSGSLNSARSGHTATALPDGTVLIAGGDNSGTPLSSLEIYSPTNGAFSTVTGSLSSPREQHAAAALPTGDVIIMGGFNGTAALATSDLYTFSTGAVAPGPVMSTPRQGLSATTQLDGNVLVAGGNSGSANASQDLATAEVYSESAGTFTLTGSLATARQGHLAFLLPHNGSILIVGGTTTVSGAETATSSVEMYYPLASGTEANPKWNGTFNPTGAMASPRVSATGSPLSNGTPTSINDGILLVAGGKDASGSTLSSGELYGFAWVNTDRLEYAPGTPVNVTGGGWQPGETVTLHFQEVPYFDTHPDVTAIADSNGNISNSQFSPDSHDIGINFVLTATGAASGSLAQTLFADAADFEISGCVSTSANCTAGGLSGVTINFYTNSTLTTAWSPASATTGTGGAYGPTTNGSKGTTQVYAVVVPPAGYDASSASVTGSCSNGFTVISNSEIEVQNPSSGGSCAGVSFQLVQYGSASKLAFTNPPTNTAAGSAIDSPTGVQVSVEDSNGNVVANSTASVTIAIGTNPGSGTLSGTTPVNAVKGVATFSNLSINKAGTGYTLAASSGTLTGTTSSGFNITAGSVNAGTSTVVASPTSVAADGSTTSTITVTLLDAGSNPVSGKTVTLTAGSGSSTISAASGASNASGVVTFTVKDTVAQAVTYTAKDTTDGTTITQTATVTFTAVGTTTTVSSSANPSTYGQSVTFTATVAPASGTTAPTGSVQFVVDGTNLGSAVTVTTTGCTTGDACATSSATTTLTAGTHSVTANYTATGSFSNSSGTLSGGQVVDKATPTLSVTNTPVAYTGSPQAATVSGSVPGTVSNIQYNGSSTTPTNAGTYAITANFAPTDSTDYNSLTAASAGNFVISQATPTVTFGTAPTPTYLGGNFTVSATTTNTDSTTLTYSQVSGPCALVSGATFSSSGAGTCVVKASGAATTNFLAASNTQNVTIAKATPTVTFGTAPTPTYLGGNFTVSATTTNTDSSTLTYSQVSGPCALVSGATFSSSGAGTCVVQASGTATTNFLAASNTQSVTIAKLTPTFSGLTASQSIPYGQASISLSGKVNGYAMMPGTVSITINSGSSGPLTLSGTPNNFSDTTFNTSTIPVSTTPYTITYTYSGDANSNSAIDTSTTLTVTKANTSTTLTSSANPSVFGQSVTFTATVADSSSGSTGNPTGTVTFKDGATTLGTGTLSGSNPDTATFTTSTLSVATHSITAAYGGDSNFTSNTSSPLSQVVNPAATTTTITNASSLATASVVGQAYAVTYSVAVNSPGVGTISGTDTVTVSDGTSTCMATVSAGACNLTSTTVGSKTITATYSGDTNFATSTSTGVSHTVNNPAPTLTSISPTNGNLSQTLNVIFTGTNFISGVSSVSFAASGITVNSTTVNGSMQITANITISSNATVGAGSVSVTNSSPGGGTATLTNAFTVNNPATSTMVASSLNPSTYGQPVTFTATVTSGGGTPTGSVTFVAGNSCLGTALSGSTSNPANLNGSGVATFTTSALPAGNSETITACYSPTGIFNASSGSVIQTVSAAATSISINAPTVVYPALGVVTVTVSSMAGTPTGNVFLSVNGGTPFGMPLNGSGVATYTAASPFAGVVNLSASYPAQGNFAASGPTTGTLTEDQAPSITSGATTTFTAGTAATPFTVTTTAFPAPALSETGALPNGLTFVDNGNGTATISGTPAVAGNYPITITASNGVGTAAMQAFALVVNAGSFTQLQILVPGETAAPGTATGQTGSPSVQYVNGPFNVIVNAVDANFNVVSSVTDAVSISSNDPQATFSPSSAALSAGTGTFSVTPETVSYNPATTTFTATDTANTSIPAATTPAIEVITAYTAAITPTMVATRQATNYTLTISNAASPNANNLASATVAIPTADQGTITGVSVSATTQPGNAPASWIVDPNPPQGYIRVRECVSGDTCFTQGSNNAVAPGGTITITFTATSSASVSSTPVQEVWNTVAFTDSQSTNALPLAPPEPTVSVGVGPSFASGASATFTYGTPGSFTVTTNGVPTNKLTESVTLPTGVMFTDNANDTATITSTSTTPAGTYSFTITAHNGFGSDATQNFSLTVKPAQVTPSITASNKMYDGTTTATVTCTLSGIIGTDNVTCSAASVNFSQAGVGTGLTVTATGITLGGTAATNYSLTMTTATTTANITQKPLAASIMANNKVFDGTTTATVTCSLSGVVSTDMGNVTCSAASANFSQANAGNGLTVTATGITLSGSAAPNYSLNSTTAQTTANITPAPTTTTVISNPNPSVYGQLVTFTAFVNNTGSQAVPTGTVSFIIDGTAVGGTLETCPSAIPANRLCATYSTSTLTVSGSPHTVSANYTNADGNFQSGSGALAGGQTVNPAPLVITASSGGPIIYGATPFVVTPIYSGFVNLETAANLTTQPTCGPIFTTTTAPGTYMTSCSGAVDSNYSISYVAGSVTITQATTTTTLSLSSATINYGDSVTVTATVAPQFTGTPTGTVSVSDGIGNAAGDSCTITLSGGTGLCTLTPSAVAPGGSTVTGNYSGDADFLASQGSTSLTVNPATTSTALTSATNPSVLGQAVTFTATVANTSTGDPAVPTGTVFFYDGTTLIGGATLNSSGNATFTTALLSSSASPHSISAAFLGNADFSASLSSTAASQTVNPRSSSTTASVNPSTVFVGQSSTVTMTVTDTATTGPSGTPGVFAAAANGLNTGRTGQAAALLPNGTVLVAGGKDPSGNVLASGEIYDPTAGTFTTTANSLKTGVTGATATPLPDGTVLIAGGSMDGTASGATSVAAIFDPTAMTFTQLSSGLTTARFNATATLLAGGKVLIAGGENSGGTLNSMEVYDPGTQTFTGIADMLSVPREGATATLLYSGQILFAGGSGLSSAEIYSPTAHTSTLLANNMTTDRTNHVAVLLPDGNVLIAGGTSSGNPVASAELFNTAAQTFTAAANNMTTPRSGLTATMLDSAQVLVIGGSNSSNAALPSVELYTPSFDPLGTVTASSSDNKDAISGNPCTLTLTGSGTTTCQVTNIPAEVGTNPHTLTAKYAPAADDVHTASDNTGQSDGNNQLTVKPADTTTSVTSTLNPSTYGQSVTFTATVSVVSPGAGTPTGTVQFEDNGSLLGSPVPLSSASASLTTSALTAGNHTITAMYSGDANFNATNFDSSSTATPLAQMVKPAPLTITASSSTINYGTPVPAITPGYSGFVNGDTAASLTTAPTCSVQSLPANDPVGTYTTSCTGAVDSNYIISYVSGSLTIKAVPLAITASSSTINYGTPVPAITPGYSGFVNGDTAASLTAAPTCSVQSLPANNPAGTYTTSCTGAVDSNYIISYVSGSLTIKAVPLTITASTGSMTYGDSTVFVVMPIFSGFVNGDGPGSLTTQPTCLPIFTSSTPAGTYTSTCSGAVDSNYAITYMTGIVMVTQASTTTAVASSLNPSTYMQLVTFTATVSPEYTGTTPTGNVTFYDTYNGSTTTLGTGTLSVVSGQDVATFSTSSLQDQYPNNITATYSGDNNFTGSTSSPPLTQTVSPAPVVSLNPLFVSFGNQNVNTSSKGASITLSNVGDAALNISTTNGISITGSNSSEFAETNTCGSSVAPNGSCIITVTFTPVDTGVATATLQVTDNDDDTTNAQQVVSLTGAGLSTISGNFLYPDAIFATANGCGSIVLSGGSTVDSFDSVSGYSSSHQLSGGNVGTNGNITLNGGKSAIYGSASVLSTTSGNCSKTSVTGLTSNGGAQAPSPLNPLGSVVSYPAPPVPNPAPPTTSNENVSGSCPSGMTGCSNLGSKDVSFAPGQYGNVSLSGGTTAHFQAGTYNINSLTLSGNSILYVDSGPVVINLAANSLSGGNPAMDVTGGSLQNPSGIPANLQFIYAGSRGLNLSGGSGSYATVYAPNALVNMSGGSDFYGSIIGSTVTNSGGTAIHYDSNLANIQAGDTLWISAVVNNLTNLGTSQVKLYLTNSSFSFTATSSSQCTGVGGTFNSVTGTCTVAVPNAVITLNSASGTLGTSYSLTSSRWNTSVPSGDLTGNTFATGVAIPVPTGGFPNGLQNVSFSTSFSTDSPGLTLNWQWGAAVYSSFSTSYATSTINNVLGVNAEDGSADTNGTDPAGTPEAYKGKVVFGGTGGGLTNYTGFLSVAAEVLPTAAQMSVSPSSLDFGTQAQGTPSSAPLTAVLTNNDVGTHYISGISRMGTDAADYTLQSGGLNNCMGMTSLAAGSSCTLYVTFTPQDIGTRTAKIAIGDDANNSPQTVYLTGTGQQ